MHSQAPCQTTEEYMPFMVWGWILIAQFAAVVYLLKRP